MATYRGGRSWNEFCRKRGRGRGGQDAKKSDKKTPTEREGTGLERETTQKHREKQWKLIGGILHLRGSSERFAFSHERREGVISGNLRFRSGGFLLWKPRPPQCSGEERSLHQVRPAYPRRKSGRLLTQRGKGAEGDAAGERPSPIHHLRLTRSPLSLSPKCDTEKCCSSFSEKSGFLRTLALSTGFAASELKTARPEWIPLSGSAPDSTGWMPPLHAELGSCRFRSGTDRMHSLSRFFLKNKNNLRVLFLALLLDSRKAHSAHSYYHHTK